MSADETASEPGYSGGNHLNESSYTYEESHQEMLGADHVYGLEKGIGWNNNGAAIHTSQQILLKGSDLENSYLVYGSEVEVVASAASCVTTASVNDSVGSSKVKINPVINYDWEQKLYIGNLVAVHLDRIHLAYVLKGKTSGSIVRVINRKTTNRILLKDFTSRIYDVSFAYITRIILGVADDVGGLHVYEITECADGTLSYSALFLCIGEMQSHQPRSDFHRIIWCQYVPEDGKGMMALCEESMICTLTHNNTAEVWNLEMSRKLYGSKPINSSQVTNGRIILNHHAQPIVDAVISPDGGAVATASLDGTVKFFKIDSFDVVTTTCVHNLVAHDGRPLSCLFFLDDQKHPSGEATYYLYLSNRSFERAGNDRVLLKDWKGIDLKGKKTHGAIICDTSLEEVIQDVPVSQMETFWRFAVTGADFNRELKIWSSQTWVCLQKIIFTVPHHDLTIENNGLGMTPTRMGSRTEVQPCMKACMDLSATYLILSDINRHVLYILQLHQEPNHAAVCSLSEFLLTQSYLSLAIIDAGRKRSTKISDDASEQPWSLTTGDVVREEDEVEVSSSVIGPDVSVLVKLFAIQARAMQEMHIRYLPVSSINRQPGSVSSTSESTTVGGGGLRDPLSDVSFASEFDRSMDPLTDEIMTPVRPTNGSTMARNSLPSKSTPVSGPLVSGQVVNRPVLMTPDAFTSPRLSAMHSTDPVSVSSSLTLVTALNDSLSSLQNPTTSIDQTLDQLPQLNASSSPSFTSPPTGHVYPSISRNVGGVTEQNLYSRHDVDDVVESRRDVNGTGRQPSTYSSSSDGGSSESTSQEVSEILENETRKYKQRQQQQEIEQLIGKGQPVLERDDDDKAETPVEELDDEDDDADVEVCEEEEDVVGGEEFDPVQHAADGTHGTSDEEDGHFHAVDRLDDQANYPRDIISGDVMCGDVVRTEDMTEEGIIYPLTDIKRSYYSHGSGGIEEGDPVTGSATRSEADCHKASRGSPLMTQLITLLRSQRDEISELKAELRRQNELSTHTEQRLAQRVDALSALFDERMKLALAQSSQTLSSLVDNMLRETEQVAVQRRNSISATVLSSIEGCVRTQIKDAVQQGIQQTIAPHITACLEPMKERFHSELAKKLTATDTLVKDNISKLTKSKQHMEMLSQATSSRFQEVFQTTCRDTLLPSFDHSCQNLLHQLASIITQGTVQYEKQCADASMRHSEQQSLTARHQLTALLEAARRREEAQTALTGQLNEVVESLRGAASSLRNGHGTADADLDASVQAQFSRLSQELLVAVRHIVSEEMSARLDEQQTTINEQLHLALRSAAPTPNLPFGGSSGDLRAAQRAQIMTLINQGSINAAFQQALSMSDVSLVEDVCERLDPDELFSMEPCPLTQSVLLSLIQHLSAADLGVNTELKHRYLEEAIAALDHSHPITREHLSAVLTQLHQNLAAFVQLALANHDKMARPMGKLLSFCELILKSSGGGAGIRNKPIK